MSEAVSGMFGVCLRDRQARFTTVNTNGDGEEVDDLGTGGGSVLGDFARLILIITLLRAVIDLAEGKGRTPTVFGFDGETGEVPRPAGRDEQLQLYTLALGRWRAGWDFDTCCSSASSYCPAPGAESGLEARFCSSALPFFWLVHVLVGFLGPDSTLPSHDGAAHTTSSTKVGPIDLTTMLRVAQQFVRSGEGVC